MASSIGRIALGVVGALIAPVGFAAVGFSIGSAIGGLLFAPSNNTSVEGPRLGDTDVQSSSLGKIIPYHYATTRTGGNVFWAGGLKEVKTTETQSQGGKGGGGSSSTQTTYSYFASFATALGRGPAEQVLRIWADGKLIYDVTGAGDVQNDKYTFRFRGGGDNQPVDPLIEESINRRLQGLDDVNAGSGPQSDYKTIDDLIAEAAASTDPRSAIYETYLTARRVEADAGIPQAPKEYRFTPAYKELCYIIFEDMPLEDFGNRIPNITAEVVWTSDLVLNPNDTVTENAIFEQSPSFFVPIRSMGIDPGANSWLINDLANNNMRLFSLSTRSETLFRPNVQTINASVGGDADYELSRLIGADANGNFIGHFIRSPGPPILAKVAPTSLDFTGVLTPDGTQHFTGQGSTEALSTFGASLGQNGVRTLFGTCGSGGEFFVFETHEDNLNTVWGTGGSTFTGLGEGPMCSGGAQAGDSAIYWVVDDGTDWQLHKVDVLFSATTGATPTVTFTDFEPTNVALAGDSISSVFYDFSSNTVFVLIQKSGGGGELRRYDPDAAGTVSDPYLQYAVPLTLTPPNSDSGFQRSGSASGRIAYANGTDAVLVDLATGSEDLYLGALSNTASPDTQMFIPTSSSLMTWIDTTPTEILFARLGANLFSTDLATILADICTNAGMTLDEFNVDAIIGDHNVRGYTVARATSGRKAMENLLQAYYVDGVETDWVLKFQNRSTTPVRTIDENELGAVRAQTGPVVWKETRQPEYDLPKDISLIYNDVDRDYQQGSAHKKRVSAPVASMYAEKNETVELPIVFNEVEAKDIAEKLLYLAWMSRDTAQGKLPWTHLDLDPTDVVQLTFDDGTRILTDRIAKTDVGANFEVDIQTVRSGDPVYISAAAAEVLGSGVPGSEILTPVFSKMFVFDIPLLYDYHDTARTSQRYYAAVGSDTTTWLSADLYDSIDNASFGNFDTAVVDVSWGQVVGMPLGAPRTLFATDTENTFTVKFAVDNGDVNSTTFDQILNNEANRALIWNQSTGKAEIIQFQDVTLNLDGTKTFSTLVRGRRGTDYYAADHDIGEFFILLTDTSVLPEINTLSLIGTTKYYKAVSRGALVGTAPSLAVPTVGRDLHPYAVTNLTRSDNGADLTVNWNRRTRLGGAWNMFGTGIEPVPLNEDNEEYEFYLLPNTPTALNDFDPTNAATYEQLQTVTTPTATVLAADLTTAGYTLADDINIAVYQLSAQVGRGFVRTMTLAV